MTRGHFGRIMILCGLGLLVALFSWEAFGQTSSLDLSVIEVHRNIPLADHDPVYKDFYINVGTDSSIKKNLVVTAVRKMTIKDSTGANSFGEISIPVGYLKVISVQNKIAVAREYKLISRDDEPMLDQNGIMIGDKIDVAGAFIDKKVASAKTSE